MAGYLDILRPQVLTQVVKQVVSSADPILNFMGFEPGGSNERFFGHGREGLFHVYDDVRKPAKGRAPGTPAARSSKQPMKAVPFVYPRMHDSVSLLAEFFHNLGQIGNPAQRDEAGKAMIMRQTQSLMQKAANWRIALTVGMLRDQLYFHEDGDDWHVSYASASSIFQVNCRTPSGNKSQLNMANRAGTSIFGASIIDVPWTSSGANIPLHIAKINQARAVQGVGPVTDIHLNSVLWQSIINNDYLAVQAGIAQSPFTTFQRETGKRPDGTPVHEYVGSFNALPGIKWHISDEGVELWDESSNDFLWTKHWADTMAVLMSDPKSRADGFTLYQGSEPIAEYDGGPKTVRVGLSAWSKDTANPTATECYILDNCLPVNHDPFAIDVATVSGF
jgi:hypothetical protein